MIPQWLDDEVRAFGRQLGLQTFSLNDRNMAAVQFENGVKLRLEYVAMGLWVQVLVPVAASGEVAERLLLNAHPSAGQDLPGGPIRAAYNERTGEAMLVVRLSEAEAEASMIDSVFRELFDRAMRLGRSA